GVPWPGPLGGVLAHDGGIELLRHLIFCHRERTGYLYLVDRLLVLAAVLGPPAERCRELALAGVDGDELLGEQLQGRLLVAEGSLLLVRSDQQEWYGGEGHEDEAQRLHGPSPVRVVLRAGSVTARQMDYQSLPT